MASRAHNPLTDTEIARIAEMHAAGKTRNDIAKDLGRSGDTITRHCRKTGLTFDRTSTTAATTAKVRDAAARRAAAQLAELDILELQQTHVIGVLRSRRKHRKILRGAEGVEVVQELNFLPADDAQKLANARSSSTTIIGNLARLDADNGAEAARSLLGGLAAALGLTDTNGPADDAEPA